MEVIKILRPLKSTCRKIAPHLSFARFILPSLSLSPPLPSSPLRTRPSTYLTFTILLITSILERLSIIVLIAHNWILQTSRRKMIRFSPTSFIRPECYGFSSTKGAQTFGGGDTWTRISTRKLRSRSRGEIESLPSSGNHPNRRYVYAN